MWTKSARIVVNYAEFFWGREFMVYRIVISYDLQEHIWLPRWKENVYFYWLHKFIWLSFDVLWTALGAFSSSFIVSGLDNAHRSEMLFLAPCHARLWNRSKNLIYVKNVKKFRLNFVGNCRTTIVHNNKSTEQPTLFSRILSIYQNYVCTLCQKGQAITVEKPEYFDINSFTLGSMAGKQFAERQTFKPHTESKREAVREREGEKKGTQQVI